LSRLKQPVAIFAPCTGTSLGGLDSYPMAKDVNNYFNFDKDIIRVPLNLWVDPPFETKIIVEDERTIFFWDHWGVKELVKKDAFCSPAYIEWPVKNRADWEKLKERRFQPSIETRVPADYPHLIKGKSEIDVELSRLPGVIKQGGYVPHVDHSVPYGVPWKNFKYFREELLKIIERTPVLS